MKMSSLGAISWREQMIINWRSWQLAFSPGMLAQLHWSPLPGYKTRRKGVGSLGGVWEFRRGGGVNLGWGSPSGLRYLSKILSQFLEHSGCLGLVGLPAFLTLWPCYQSQ